MFSVCHVYLFTIPLVFIPSLTFVDLNSVYEVLVLGSWRKVSEDIHTHIHIHKHLRGRLDEESQPISLMKLIFINCKKEFSSFWNYEQKKKSALKGTEFPVSSIIEDLMPASEKYWNVRWRCKTSKVCISGIFGENS